MMGKLVRQNPIDAFELEMRIRNNAIRERRERLSLDQEQLGKQADVSKSAVAQYETLRMSPKDSRTGEWKSTAIRLSKFFGVQPEVLWPDVVQMITDPVIKRKANQHEVEKLYALEMERARERAELADPEMRLALAERSESLERALGLLNNRERTIIEMRFGLNGNIPMTLAEVGIALGRSRERIRSIEAGGFHKLRGQFWLRHDLAVDDLSPRRTESGALASKFFVEEIKSRGMIPSHDVVVPYGDCPWNLRVSCKGGVDAMMRLSVRSDRRVEIVEPFKTEPTPLPEVKTKSTPLPEVKTKSTPLPEVKRYHRTVYPHVEHFFAREMLAVYPHSGDGLPRHLEVVCPCAGKPLPHRFGGFIFSILREAYADGHREDLPGIAAVWICQLCKKDNLQGFADLECKQFVADVEQFGPTSEVKKR